MLSYIFILLFIQSFAFTQIREVNVSIDSRNNKKNTSQYLDQYLEKLKNDIEFYILSNNFLETNNEDIEISLDINIIIENISNNIVSSYILFSNRSDQILLSDGIDFKYELGQNLIYTTTYNSLTSFLNYNIFIIIGGELDKYIYKGGENYYIRSENIAFQGTLSEYTRRWKKRLKQCKKLKENIYLRNIKYMYNNIDNYLNSTDDEFDEEIIVSNLESIYEELVNIQDDYGYNKNTILFLNYNLEQLVDLYYEYDMIYVIKFLNQYDKDNSEFYNDYMH